MDPEKKNQQPPADDPSKETPPADDPAGKGDPEGGKMPDDVRDKHGQPGINKERHEKEMAEKDAKIAELEAKVAEAAKTEESRAALEKEIADVKASQAEERVTYKLELAGCKSVKAAKALLEDCDNDIDKLKKEHPYLFEKDKPTGSTGKKPEGAPDASEKRLQEARELAGIRVKE